MRISVTGVSRAAITLALATSATTAFAQSTGAIDFEQEIVVTGSNTNNGVAGVLVPNTSKAKAVLTQEFIGRQTPGQSINETINQLPGVSFQNNDPYGSGGGTLTIRGFNDQRITQTFDGMPLNDTGGYDLYSNQQLDSEIIDQVNVNLGTTDVDSPTAAATGSTVNYRSINPNEELGGQLSASYGRFDYTRLFGIFHTGNLTPSGTRAFISASKQDYDTPYGGIGKIDKLQVNGKIYQPIGDNGDFVWVAAHYNRNRNNFFGSVPFRTDLRQISATGVDLGPRNPGGSSSNRFPLTRDERFYEVSRCEVEAPSPGVAGFANSCGSDFEYRYNPSDTGNIRANSRFSLTDKLTLTVDPSYQYTKANGGGTAVANEGLFNGFAGYIGSTPYYGRDLNNDGDLLDTVRVLAPSQTKTHRLGLNTSLRYDINDDHSIRIAYSYDRGKHRQTGETNYITGSGKTIDPFPVDDPIVGAGDITLQKRDRLSYAILHQVSGEYRGTFDALTVNAGVRAPFFKRNLNQNCFTTNGASGVSCFDGDSAAEAAYAAANPTFAAPQKRIYKYDKILPNAGLVFEITPQASLFANYSKGLQVPGTDNLYQAFWYPRDLDAANPSPETTDNFDVGVRFRTGRLQAMGTVWYTLYKNRLASAYDRDQNITIYRNLGKVEKYGIDGSLSYQPIDEVSLSAFGSYLKSKIKDNVEGGICSASNVSVGQFGCATAGQAYDFQTRGKRESGAPTYTFGGRAQVDVKWVSVGVQVKRTGPRYYNDQNLPVLQTYTTGTAPDLTYNTYQVFGAKIPAYTTVDLDARISLAPLGVSEKTFFQLNVTNLFDKRYYGGFDGGNSSQYVTQTGQIGAPRAVSGTVVVGF
ncbi:TonB-dependent receptor [Sphingomonas sp. ID0503]|uniref:TonB-dependent receptor n=1 Tax=Sphingomonas sp. ID0503 TaxID=3399691 RepID=UPI003AFABFD8